MLITVLSRGEEGIVTRIDPLDPDDRTVVAGELSGMDNAAFDADNHMFVSSFAAGGIAELAPDGRTRRIVPTGFCGPYGVAVESAGAVFAGDGYRLAGIDGDATTTRELFLLSHGAAADDRGRVHLTSQYGTVSSYEPQRRRLTKRAEELDRPIGLAARSDGALVVAETGACRVVVIDDDALTVLVDGLDAPVDVTVDDQGRCHVCDEQRGTVARIDDGELVPVAEGLNQPQGIDVHGGELFVVETGRRRLLAIDLASGEATVEAEDLGVGLPPGLTRVQPALFNHGLPGVPAPFAGIAVGGDGALYVSANGEGTILGLKRDSPPPG